MNIPEFKPTCENCAETCKGDEPADECDGYCLDDDVIVDAVEQALEIVGADGLVNYEEGCGDDVCACILTDFMLCGDVDKLKDCLPAKIIGGMLYEMRATGIEGDA